MTAPRDFIPDARVDWRAEFEAECRANRALHGQNAALTAALDAVTHQHAPDPDEAYDFCWCGLSRFAPIHCTPRVALAPWANGRSTS